MKTISESILSSSNSGITSVIEKELLKNGSTADSCTVSNKELSFRCLRHVKIKNNQLMSKDGVEALHGLKLKNITSQNKLGWLVIGDYNDPEITPKHYKKIGQIFAKDAYVQYLEITGNIRLTAEIFDYLPKCDILKMFELNLYISGSEKDVYEKFLEKASKKCNHLIVDEYTIRELKNIAFKEKYGKYTILDIK